MSSSLRSLSPRVLLIALLLAFFFTSVGCGTSYSEQPMVLVWEADISGSSARLYPTDAGTADIAPLGELGSGLLPTAYFDSSGKKTGELNWLQFRKPDWDQAPELDHMTEFGWATLDRKVTYERWSTPGSSGARAVYLESVVRMVSRDGEVIWETPGLAQAYLFHVDDSVIGCYGKNPALLNGISGDVFSSEYASQVIQRYAESPTRVMLLDSATGSIRAEFDLPDVGYFTPDALVSDEGLYNGSMVLSIEDQGGRPPAIGFLLSSVPDGLTVKSVDLRKALPNMYLLTYSPAGLLASCQDNTMSVVDLEGRVLRTGTPERARESNQIVQAVWSSAEGLVMVKCAETASYVVSKNVTTPFMAITVFGRNQNVLVYQRDLKNMFVSAQEASRVLAVGESSRVGEDYLYVFDMGKDAVTVSRARIPVFDSYAVSPSGEFVLTVRKASEGQLQVSMYRLD
ncbi:MAG: hypothetical protein WD024_08825 [Bacillota bacterium]